MIVNNKKEQIQQANSNQIKILKSYYNRDAAASVSKSFLNIENDFYINNNNNNNNKEAETSKLNSSVTSVCSSISSSNSSATNNNNNAIKINEKIKQLTITKEEEQEQQNSNQSCILFLNQLVDKSLNTNGNNTNINKESFQSTSILKEITITSQDSINNESDGCDEDLSNNNNTSNNKKTFSSSSSSTNSSVSAPKNNFVKFGVKLINNKINKLLNNTTNSLKKSDSSNSSSSINLSASSSFNNNKRVIDQVDNHSKKMFYNSNSQSDFISYSNQQQTQLQLLNSKKLRKLLPLNSGLKNHGNTCFMNCVLQCLFHTSPLADFFITDQFQRDMQYITHHEKFNQLQQQQNNHLKHYNQQHQQQQHHHSNLPQFILTKHFYRLLTSMWRNSYDSNYSAELKHLIGYMNPTFAGGSQNDSHELCVWLLDKLSQELTIRIETPISTQLLLNNAKNQVKIQSLSFIEELFQVQFKSTVICSKCNYKSSKYETDMMLSLPLPQKNSNNINNTNNKNKQTTATNNKAAVPPTDLKQKQRRSLYAHLILSNQPSIKNITSDQQQMELNQQLERSRSKFYMPVSNNNNDSIESKLDESDLKSESNDLNEMKTYLAPFHVKIGINIQVNMNNNNNECKKSTAAPICNNKQNGDSSCSSVSSTTSSISSSSSAAVSSTSSTSCPTANSQSSAAASSSSNNILVSSITINELRRNIAATYQLRFSDLVFIDLNRIQLILNDSQSVKDTFLVNNNNNNNYNKYNDLIRTTIDSLCVVELNSPSVKTQPNMPLINIIGINVYYETVSSYTNQQQQQQATDNCDSKPIKKCVCYGLPFVLLINRDCSYSDLCKKLLEAQFKYFKDKIMLKYKDLVEKLFTLSLNDPDTQERVKLNPNDELPLYAECVEKFINNTLKISRVNSCVEYIKLNVEWRSFEDISNLFKEIDSSRPEFIHKSVRLMQNLDESELNIKKCKTSSTESGLNNNNNNNTDSSIPSAKPGGGSSNSTTLNDCFELFTQREELTDENSWMCPKCKKQTNATKKLCINSVPPILIIHLKRFFYKSKSSNFKLTTPVWFPTCNLDISKYISTSSKSSSTSKRNCTNKTNTSSSSSSESLNENNKSINDDEEEDEDENNIEVVNNENRDQYNQSYVYDLFAVCNHKGQNMANGHYTAYCKNLIDTRWYCFDDATCTPLVESASNSQSNIYNSGSTGVCSENAYILFYKKRNCMRNEKWWIDYIDRSLLDSDEFDRFVNNLELIETEQQKYQMQQQNLQLKQQKQQQQQQKVNQTNVVIQQTTTNPIEVNLNNTKKSSGLNKTFRKLWLNNNNKSNTPINNDDEELNALRRVLYDNNNNNNDDDDKLTTINNNNNNNNSSQNYVSSNLSSVDSELVAINTQAELQRIQQKRFEEAIKNNYYINKQSANNGNINLPFNNSDNSVNHYNETVKPTRLNNTNNNKVLSVETMSSFAGESVNESEPPSFHEQQQQPVTAVVPPPVLAFYQPQPQPQKFTYNNEFKKPYNGYFNEYKIPVPEMPPTPTNGFNQINNNKHTNTNNNRQVKEIYQKSLNDLNASLESTERYYLNSINNNNNNSTTSTYNDNNNDLTTTEDINNVSSYHNNQNSSSFNSSNVDSLLSYPSDNEYMYNNNQPLTASMVHDYIINNSKAYYMSNNLNTRNGLSLTPIQEHQFKTPSPPFDQQQQQSNKLPITQPRKSNLKNTNHHQQQNTKNIHYINTSSIETPI